MPFAPMTTSAENTPSKTSNFLRQIVENDLKAGTYAMRRFGGTPGDAAHHAHGKPDWAKIRTRFPPEPNGYLHIGHAKSICLNFGMAQDYEGICHLRFDDTNPEKEDVEYIESIKDIVQWLGFNWEARGVSYLYFASDYFDFMYRAACTLIDSGHAYVDEQTPEEMRANRGDFNTPGINSPYRNRTPAENKERFEIMRSGALSDGAAVLRAKIDMSSPNINMRDPAIYRIKHAVHHRTGNAWCIYPMYTFAHPIEDALEEITHSFCTLEFEDQRPFYEWLLDRLCEIGLLAPPLPKQYEFARLNLSYVVTSKRKLKQLVENQLVSGWDDPRMPTLVGLRRRGYTPEAIRLFCERVGISKAASWIDYGVLETALRDDLETKATRAMAVLEPVKLTLTNWAELFGSDSHVVECEAPCLPSEPQGKMRHFKLARELWIERTDFEEIPPRGYRRLFPGNRVRLKYGCIVECTGCVKDDRGNIIEVLASVVPDTLSGTPGADAVKVKGTITWVAQMDGVQAEIRLYDRLFSDEYPDAGGKDFLQCLNPNNLRVLHAYIEPQAAIVDSEVRLQFERHGYFVADRVDHSSSGPVFNRITSLKDNWKK